MPAPARTSDEGHQIKEVGPSGPQSDALESKETRGGDNKKTGPDGGGIMDRKFSKYVKADEVFESDD